MTFSNQKTRTLIYALSLCVISLFTVDNGNAYTALVFEKCVEGNGIEVTVEKQALPFNILEISGAFIVNAHSNQIDKHIRITGDENILPLIKTSSQGNHLVIYPEKPICPELEITVDIAGGDLNALIANSSGKITIDEIYTGKFTLVSNGTGDIQLSGYTEVLDAEIAGSGDFESSALKTKKVFINSSGNGTISVNATKRLQVDITGASDIFYSGNPQEVVHSLLGPGSLSEAD